MKNLKPLIKRIQELVPEIMELKFGCRLKNSGYDRTRTFLGWDDNSCDSLETKKLMRLWTGRDNERILVKDIDEILGRPITLEDVMVALSKRQWIYEQYYETYIDESGNFFEKHPTLHIPSSLGVKWELGKPLHEQSQELINYLWEILCQNQQEKNTGTR